MFSSRCETPHKLKRDYYMKASVFFGGRGGGGVRGESRGKKGFMDKKETVTL